MSFSQNISNSNWSLLHIGIVVSWKESTLTLTGFANQVGGRSAPGIRVSLSLKTPSSTAFDIRPFSQFLLQTISTTVDSVLRHQQACFAGQAKCAPMSFSKILTSSMHGTSSEVLLGPPKHLQERFASSQFMGMSVNQPTARMNTMWSTPGWLASCHHE